MLILLGHQMVPHAHGLETDESSISASENANTGWLGRVFSLDQGADHLEHFRPAAASESQPDLHVTVLPHTILRVAINQPLLAVAAPLTPQVVPIPQIFIANAPLLRGPPSC